MLKISAIIEKPFFFSFLPKLEFDFDLRLNFMLSRVAQHEFLIQNTTHCSKITKKVSFNIASEASYVYILNEQEFIENAKNSQF